MNVLWIFLKRRDGSWLGRMGHLQLPERKEVDVSSNDAESRLDVLGRIPTVLSSSILARHEGCDFSKNEVDFTWTARTNF